MNSAQNPTRIEEVKIDPIGSASPGMFVISCLILAHTNAVPLSDYSPEMMDVASSIYSASSMAWISGLVSLLMMFALGLPSIKNQLSALAVAVVGSVAILVISAFQVSWLVMMMLIFAIIIPVGNLAFSKFMQ